MHRLVDDRRRDFSVRELRVHSKCQLDEARTLLVEVCSPTSKALHHYVREISFEMTEVVRDVALDQGETSLQPRDYSASIDFGPRVVDDHGNPKHVVARSRIGWPFPGEEPDKLGQHPMKNNVSPSPKSLQLACGPRHICAPMTTKNTTVLDARAVERTLKRMSVEIVELNRGTDDLIIVGIQRRGVQLADRLVKMIEGGEGVTVPQGSLDITLYRDDLQTIGPRPVVGPTYLPWDLENKHIIIVDDVLYTGRTVRAALDELADFGRPASISLAVLIDRGGRELPIHADVVGKRVDVGEDERVDVMVAELDERTEVIIVPKSA